ncbi:response regulator transcription factor [bacterium]|nr:response regulator transcription factor [bacterium]
MNVIIIEDEISAVQNMLALLKEIDASINVRATLESVEATVQWIENNESPELAFVDIQLADGNSFEIFEQTEVKFPVVFTTAFNEYALKAFKVNSIDYILKPIKKSDLEFAIDKYQTLADNFRPSADSQFMSALQSIQNKLAGTHKKTLLIQKYDGFVPMPVSDFAFFHIHIGVVRGITFSNEKLDVNVKLDTLESQLSPEDFFRANRQAIIARKAVTAVNNYFNGRLLVKTMPASPEQIIVSKARAGAFKRWLER